MNKEFKAYRQKMSPEELQEYLAFRRHGFYIASKKGKGSYKRKKIVKE